MATDSPPPDCSHPHQEVVLRCLNRHASVAVRDLVDAVLEREYDRVTEAPEKRREAVARALKRRHIPELVERSYARYDEDREVVNLLGRGTDAPVEPVSEPACAVDLQTEADRTVAVDLHEDTIDALHEAMLSTEGLDPEMSYDEAVRRLVETDE